jgi:hypothetical protein
MDPPKTTTEAYTPPPDRVHGVMIMRYYDHGKVYETEALYPPYRESLPLAEREMVTKYGLDRTKIALSGVPLKEVPHGFVCIYGTQSEMQLLVDRFQAEHEDSRAAAIKNVSDGEFERDDYGEDNKPYDPRDTWDIRLKAASMLAPEDQYIFGIFEKGKWTIPGGKRMLGETSRECAERELFEETGLKIPITEDAYAHPQKNMGAIIFAFRPLLYLHELKSLTM